jgi:hypothetical protein
MQKMSMASPRFVLSWRTARVHSNAVEPVHGTSDPSYPQNPGAVRHPRESALGPSVAVGPIVLAAADEERFL